MLANSTQCLSIEPFVAQKEGPAYSYRQERRPGKEPLRRPDTGKHKLGDSRLHLPLPGREEVGVGMFKSVFLAWAQLPSALCVANLPPPDQQFRGRSSASEEIIMDKDEHSDGRGSLLSVTPAFRRLSQESLKFSYPGLHRRPCLVIKRERIRRKSAYLDGKKCEKKKLRRPITKDKTLPHNCFHQRELLGKQIGWDGTQTTINLQGRSLSINHMCHIQQPT